MPEEKVAVMFRVDFDMAVGRYQLRYVDTAGWHLTQHACSAADQLAVRAER